MQNRIRIEELKNNVGETVEIAGRVHVRRDHGKLIFIDLRDESGLVQVVFTPKEEKAHVLAQTIRPEWVIKLMGDVKRRPENMVNTDEPNGTLEFGAKEIEVLSESQTPPYEVTEDSSKVGEEVRLKHRYVDLRTERMQKNLRLRSAWVQGCREYLFKNNFTEIETPLLSQATPEGSRDFVVPSRKYPGQFYALPQSPQQYKQLLMGSGFENYFQIAKALRDEDPRADRGYEHTQVDIEMAFVDREMVLGRIEEMIITVVENLGYTIKEKPFPRYSYADAMKKFNDDKFDLRTEEDKKNNVLAYAWVIDFPLFEPVDDAQSKNIDEGGWTFSHNPFSMPMPEFERDLIAGKNIENIISTQYDLVCNGSESGGGSIRAHKAEILAATYKVMGYSEGETKESVGHMLEAFSYGIPPHGGIALGVERNIMNLTGENYLREVQAFPMTGKGQTSVMDAPGELDKKQLDELGISVKKKK